MSATLLDKGRTGKQEPKINPGDKDPKPLRT